MEKITSFTIDHIRLQPGLYVSRKDKVGEQLVTTFDLRLTKPKKKRRNGPNKFIISRQPLRCQYSFGDCNPFLRYAPFGGRVFMDFSILHFGAPCSII